MKTILVLIVAGLLESACAISTKSADNNEMPADSPKTGSLSVEKTKSDKAVAPGNLLLLKDAEKVLGERGHLNDSSSTRDKDALTYLCSYKANTEDPKSKKTGAIYLLVEQYNELAAAQKKYTFIKTANQDHGIKTLDGLGDEAYFHSDNQNFYFVMVRKDKKVFNMKVNKITSNTSLDAFNAVARQITDGL